MALSDPLSIRLKFGNRILPMQIERADEYIYREAEKLINSRFGYYAAKYPEQGNEMYLLMTSLDIAVRLKRLETEKDPEPLKQTIGTLIREVEQALTEN